jgi:hypothetical protein
MKRLLVAFCLWAIAICRATASTGEIGQLTPPTGSLGQVQIAVMQPFGQSFTATSATITSIALQFVNMNMDFDMSRDLFVELRLFGGADFSAPLLATSRVNVDSVIGSNLSMEGPVYFPFGNVPVTVGSVYSFEVQTATARYGVYWPGMDNYDGGSAIFFGAPIDADLNFAVVGAVPEPVAASLLLVGLPVLATAICRHQRRRKEVI